MRARLPRNVRARLGGSDIFQLTALELMRIRERFEDQGMGAFRELVATIADHALSKAVRKEHAMKRTPHRESPQPAETSAEVTPLGPGAIDSHTPSRTARSRESVEKLQACLAELIELDRTIVRMIDYEGRTSAEVAEHLGLTTAAVQKRHSRIVARLRERMTRED